MVLLLAIVVGDNRQATRAGRQADRQPPANIAKIANAYAYTNTDTDTNTNANTNMDTNTQAEIRTHHILGT